mgnify:CR=1 FL=1
MNRPLTAVLLLLCTCLLGVSLAQAGNWPAWRGPNGTGVAQEKNLPVQWSKEKNVAWSVAMPGEGNSTPIVWGDQVFVTCATDGGKMRSLMCYHRDDGKLQWAKTVVCRAEEKTHKTNPHCSASPVTDGERIIVWYGSAGLYCYDMEGNEQWKLDLGKFEHIWGNASSPVIYKDTVILNAGPGMRTFLAAFDKKTGEEKWRRTLADATSKTVDELRGSWSAPVLYQHGGRDLMALSMPKHLIAFDPESGDTVWTCEGLSLLSYSSPLVGDGVVVGMSGYHGPAIAVKTGGMGDVTETHRLWLHDNKNPQRVGSGVIVDGHIYILNENGIAWCLDLESGEKQWEERLGGRSWASMSHVDGKLYVSNQDGTTYVLEVNPQECKVLAENHLDELTRASHAFSNGQVFIRTYKQLWCIEAKGAE